MSEDVKRSPLVRAREMAAAGEWVFRHPLNPRSECHFTAFDGVRAVSEQAGLSRLGVDLVRIAPGKESFEFHAHQCEEEFLYVVSGRGIAEVGDEQFEIGPGDFLGFPTPQIAHHLRNPFAADLVCLMGGERRDVEIVDFPRQRKRMIRIGQTRQVVDFDHLAPFPRPV